MEQHSSNNNRPVLEVTEPLSNNSNNRLVLGAMVVPNSSSSKLARVDWEAPSNSNNRHSQLLMAMVLLTHSLAFLTPPTLRPTRTVSAPELWPLSNNNRRPLWPDMDLLWQHSSNSKQQ